MTDWLPLLLHTLKAPGSNLSSEIGFPDWGLSWFHSVS